MKHFLLLLAFMPLFSKGQSTYQGFYGKPKVFWIVKINTDNSIYIVRNTDAGYDEYKGKIFKINDTLFIVKARLTFGQSMCIAISDSILFVSLDSTMRHRVQNIYLINNKGKLVIIPILKRSNVEVLIDKDFCVTKLAYVIKGFRINKSSGNSFIIFGGHWNPINNKIVTTSFKYKSEYGLEFYTDKNEKTFKVVIKNGTFKRIGQPAFDDFVIKKVSTR
jgi:hypothetical protein